MRHAASTGRMPVPRPDRRQRKPGRRRMTSGPAGPASAVTVGRPTGSVAGAVLAHGPLEAPKPIVSSSGAIAPPLATTLVRSAETRWPEPVSLPGTTAGPMGLDAAGPNFTAPEPVTGGRAAGRGADKPSGTSWVTQIPYALALIGVAGGLVAIRQSTPHLRSGTLVLAGALLFAALARMVLPDRRAGMLSSRRRWLDTVIFAAFGVSLLVVALVVLPPS